jgi:hypothetical protein
MKKFMNLRINIWHNCTPTRETLVKQDFPNKCLKKFDHIM